MVECIEKYKRKNIITLHGRIFGETIKSYYKGSMKLIRCLGECKRDMLVHVGGTGVMAYHTDAIQFLESDFEIINMTDIWAAKKANENKIPIVCMEHEVGFIRHSTDVDKKDTIYAKHYLNDSVQTKIVNEITFNKYESFSDNKLFYAIHENSGTLLKVNDFKMQKIKKIGWSKLTRNRLDEIIKLIKLCQENSTKVKNNSFAISDEMVKDLNSISLLNI